MRVLSFSGFPVDSPLSTNTCACCPDATSKPQGKGFDFTHHITRNICTHRFRRILFTLHANFVWYTPLFCTCSYMISNALWFERFGAVWTSIRVVLISFKCFCNLDLMYTYSSFYSHILVFLHDVFDVIVYWFNLHRFVDHFSPFISK
jgi:hypothetical protein